MWRARGSSGTGPALGGLCCRGPGNRARDLSRDLWITGYVIDCDGKPASTISIMEFRDGKVAHETQCFADPFAAADWRAQWVESVPGA